MLGWVFFNWTPRPFWVTPILAPRFHAAVEALTEAELSSEQTSRLLEIELAKVLISECRARVDTYNAQQSPSRPRDSINYDAAKLEESLQEAEAWIQRIMPEAMPDTLTVMPPPTT